MSSKSKSSSRSKLRKLRKHCNIKYLKPLHVNVPIVFRLCDCFAVMECCKKTPVVSGGLPFSVKLQVLEKANPDKGFNLHCPR